MFFSSKKRLRASRSFNAPAGERIYAIGDVHGRSDLLDELLALIDADDAERETSRTRLIFLGDLVDRGPASAAVIARVRTLTQASDRVQLLKGNHEEIFVAAARGDRRAARGLMGIGGLQTLESYGISKDEAEHGTFEDLAHLLLDRIPREDVDFLDAAPNLLTAGDYVFVHAGISPGVPLDAQLGRDTRWIREPFLSRVRNDGVMVVHGHTITAQVDEQPDRIGIDTGAYASGVLTAIGLEGSERWFLQTGS